MRKAFLLQWQKSKKQKIYIWKCEKFLTFDVKNIYGYDRQAKGRAWTSRPPNPRTNKLKDIFCYFDFCLWSYNQNNLLKLIFECQVVWVYIFLIKNNCMNYICWLVSTFLLINIRCPFFFSLIFLTTNCVFSIMENWLPELSI